MFGNLFKNAEQRAISFQSIWGAGDTFAMTTEAGNNIDQIEAVEIYYLSESVNIVNAPTDKTKCFDLTSGKAI